MAFSGNLSGPKMTDDIPTSDMSAISDDAGTYTPFISPMSPTQLEASTPSPTLSAASPAQALLKAFRLFALKKALDLN